MGEWMIRENDNIVQSTLTLDTKSGNKFRSPSAQRSNLSIIFKKNQKEAKPKSKIYLFVCQSSWNDSNRIESQFNLQWLHVPVHLSNRRKWQRWSRSYGTWSKNVQIHCYHYSFISYQWHWHQQLNSPWANEIWCSHPKALVILKCRVEISPNRTLKCARDNYCLFFQSDFSFLEWFNFV